MQVVEESLVTVAKAVEEQLDDEIAKLDMLDDDDLERLRERRLLQMKKQASQRQQWLAQGHGEYQEIFSEKEFFAVAKTSDHVICHFYRENWPCKVCNLFTSPADLVCPSDWWVFERTLIKLLRCLL
jgi:hypothetical protein